jgi:hypothetical protein
VLNSPMVADATLADGTGAAVNDGSATTTLQVRADGTADGRRVALLRVALPPVGTSSTHSHWLALQVAASSGTGTAQAHIYGISNIGWSESGVAWSGMSDVLRQGVGAGTTIDYNVIAGQGTSAQILGQLVATGTTPTTCHVDVSKFVNAQTGGVASFLIVQDHRWDSTQLNPTDPVTVGDLQPAGILVNSREASSGQPVLRTLANNALLKFRADQGLALDGSQDATVSNDGISALLKYAFNMIGTGPGQKPTADLANVATLTPGGSAGLPFASLDGSGKMALTYVRRKASGNPGVVYQVEFSSDLVGWAINPLSTESATDIDATLERVTVTDSLSTSSASRRFARVRVTQR